VLSNLLQYEAEFCFGHFLDTSLDHVISIVVKDEVCALTVQFVHYLNLKLSWQNFNRLLEHSTAVLIKTQLLHLCNDYFSELVKLLGLIRLQHPLDHVVTKHISHQRLLNTLCLFQ